MLVMKEYIENIQKLIEYDIEKHEDWYIQDFVYGATKYEQLTKKLLIKQNSLNNFL